MFKTIENYFKGHVSYNSAVHLLMGFGLGILVTYPLVGPHPVRWGLLFLGLGTAGHLYPVFIKKSKRG